VGVDFIRMARSGTLVWLGGGGGRQADYLLCLRVENVRELYPFLGCPLESGSPQRGLLEISAD